MKPTEYHQRIIDYYQDTENAYKDSWDLNNSLSIHYGYWDQSVNNFPESLLRMNAVMMKAADIKPADRVLDAGCGVGGNAEGDGLEGKAENRNFFASYAVELCFNDLAHEAAHLVVIHVDHGLPIVSNFDEALLTANVDEI